MLIIFGIQRKAARLATVFALCAFCHTPAAQVVTRIKSYFALFFIPIIPMSTHYRATCTMCGQTSEITAEEAEQAVHAQAVHQGAAQVLAPTAGAPVAWGPPPLPAPQLPPPLQVPPAQAPPPFSAPPVPPPTTGPSTGA